MKTKTKRNIAHMVGGACVLLTTGGLSLSAYLTGSVALAVAGATATALFALNVICSLE
jgi:hypothetical protein